MSRSYRAPFSTIWGKAAHKGDKRLASSGVRRKQNHWLRTEADFDAAVIPHKLECHWNDRWDWASDGGNVYRTPPSLADFFWRGDFDLNSFRRGCRNYLRMLCK